MNGTHHDRREDFPTSLGLPKIEPPEGLSDPKAVDVLKRAGGVMAVMNRMVGQSLAYRSKSGGHSDKERDDEYVEDCEARAAVAELIEADKAYDRANYAMSQEDANEDPEAFEATRERLAECIARRAAALSRCGGAP